MSIIILDLDNTISDDSWRRKFIRWEEEDLTARFHEYHSMCGFDAAKNYDLFDNCRHEIVIFTARPEMYRTITQEWLRRQRIFPRLMLMRGNNDYGSTVEIKRGQLRWMLNFCGIDQDQIVGAYDDRRDVVEMYLENDIPATQRFITPDGDQT